ncbi:hypothetical protein KKA33_01625 [Patescibacteria group bacterium]|nr:hypothetical protein [Patescibacteria group bacterium]
MNIKSTGSPECPDWMKRFKPTDLKWLNAERTAALCVLNGQRYQLKLISTEDGSTRGARSIEVASTQDTELKRLEQAFDSFEPSEKTEAQSLSAITDQVRQKLAT